METRPGQGVLKEEKFPNTRKHSHRQVCGEFWNLRGQHNQEEKINKYNPQITCLTATPRGEVAQILVSATSKVGAALFRVGTEHVCPEGNLRELA